MQPTELHHLMCYCQHLNELSFGND